MNTVVECSWIMIWVPVKGYVRSINENRTEPCPNDGGGHSISAQRSSVGKLIEQFNCNGYTNNGFVVDDASGISCKKTCSNSSGFESDLTISTSPKESMENIEDASNSIDDLEMTVHNLLVSIQVSPKTWLSNCQSYRHFSFCLENHRIEDLIFLLQEHGIGNTCNTSVSVIPASLHLEVPTQ